MIRSKDIRRYSKLLLGTTDINQMPAVLKELHSINNVILKSRELTAVFANPMFSAPEREKAVVGVSKLLGLSEKTVRFVVFLSGKGLIADLGGLIETAAVLYLEKVKRAKAVVISPVDIRSKYDGRLKASLKKLTEREVDIDYVIDPSLLGGMIVRVGSTMYDSSIKGQLRLLKSDLMKSL